AVGGRAGDLLRQAGDERRHARHVAIVLASLVGAAHVDLVDRRGVELAALDGGREDAGGQVVGADAREDARVAADRSAHGVEDHGFRHGAGAYTRPAWTNSRHSSCSGRWWWSGSSWPSE